MWDAFRCRTHSVIRQPEEKASVAPDNTSVLEAFFVSLYPRSCSFTEVIKARIFITAQALRNSDLLPLMNAVLIEHFKKAVAD